jgi:hypothetical protein
MGAKAYPGAVEDYSKAAKEFQKVRYCPTLIIIIIIIIIIILNVTPGAPSQVGDRVTSQVASAGRALALYGSGRVQEAVDAMSDVVIRTPTVTGDLELLLDLSDREAEIHAALAAHYWGDGKSSLAESEWDR